MSETNLKQSNPQHAKYNNAVYYNHMLHFKQSGSNDHFPFLQGLMSNDLFPIWIKTIDEVSFEAKVQQDAAQEELAQEILIEDHIDTKDATQEEDNTVLIDDTATSDQIFEAVDNEAIVSDSVDNMSTIEESTINADGLIEDKNDVVLPEAPIDEDSILVPNEVTEDINDQVVMTEEKSEQEVIEASESHNEATQESTEDERFTITELMQGVEEVSEEPNKKRKLKQRQKKILKKNILFFKELPELNSFNKWLIQQKPMEEGNLVKLLKLSKKAKKLDKKRQLNEGIEASIQKNDKLVSEVLAKILASQGHYVEAIEMYKQLILNIPEKSDTFAHEIDELNKKII